MQEQQAEDDVENESDDDLMNETEDDGEQDDLIVKDDHQVGMWRIPEVNN